MGQDELSPELGGWLWGLAAGSRKRRWVGFRGVGQSAEGSTHTAGGGGLEKVATNPPPPITHHLALLSWNFNSPVPKKQG